MEWLRTASCSSLCVISGTSIRVPAGSESVTLPVKPYFSQAAANVELTVLQPGAAVGAPEATYMDRSSMWFESFPAFAYRHGQPMRDPARCSAEDLGRAIQTRRGPGGMARKS